LEVLDFIEGRFSEAIGRFYFHPNVKVIPDNSSSQGAIQLLNGSKIKFHIIKGYGKFINSEYNPEFGLSFKKSMFGNTI